ncbi:ras and EF-hand domain-containing protein [Aplochiton taeniatus]
MDTENTNVFTAAWEDFQTRLGEEVKLIPRNEQVATLYQNISITEPRLVVQYERVIMNFTREIRQHNTELENLALAVKRAQDLSAMQLSEMEEEMDQRIHAAEENMLLQETKRGEAALNELRRRYEAEVCELQHKLQKMQVIEEQYKTVNMKDESPALKRRINELMLENQKLKQELMQFQTNMACLQSEMDTLKTELTDRSIDCEQDEELMRRFSYERDSLERQIQILQTANRKLHDSNDGLRLALENSLSKSTKRGNTVSPGSAYRSRSKSICYSSPIAMMEGGLSGFIGASLASGCMGASLASLASGCIGASLAGPLWLYRRFFGLWLYRRLSGCIGASLASGFVGASLASLASGCVGAFLASLASGCVGAFLALQEPLWPLAEKKEDSKDLGYMTSERAYRIVLAGDAAVGKSSFLLRLCKQSWEPSSSTLGVDFETETLIVDGEPTLVQLWDTAGQERFRSIAKSYFRRADGVLLLYDVTCERSFLNVREWVDIIEDVSQEDIPIMLLGNKCDLRQQALQDGIPCIPTSYGEKLAMVSGSIPCSPCPHIGVSYDTGP